MNELAPTALMVREVGVTRMADEVQANVITSSDAILKKELDAWGG